MSLVFAPAEGEKLNILIALSPVDFFDDSSLFRGVISIPALSPHTFNEVRFPFIKEGVAEDNVYHCTVGAGTEFFGYMVYVFTPLISAGANENKGRAGSFPCNVYLV